MNTKLFFGQSNRFLLHFSQKEIQNATLVTTLLKWCQTNLLELGTLVLIIGLIISQTTKYPTDVGDTEFFRSSVNPNKPTNKSCWKKWLLIWASVCGIKLLLSLCCHDHILPKMIGYMHACMNEWMNWNELNWMQVK